MTEVEKQILVEIVGLVTCASKVVKVKEHLPFCRESSILCTEDRVVVDRPCCLTLKKNLSLKLFDG